MNEGKGTFEQWCEVTTCAGVIDFYRSKTCFGKTIWAIFIAVCLLLTMWQTSAAVVGFVSARKYQTTISIINDQSPPFPNTTICNFNRIDKTLIGDVDVKVLSYALSAMGPVTVHAIQHSPQHISDDVEMLWQEMKERLNVENMRQLVMKYGHQCNDTFLFCQWVDTPFDCCQEAIPVVTSFGLCWTISPKINSRHQMPMFTGFSNGMQIVVNPKLDAYFDGLMTNVHMEEGILVHIGYLEQVDMFNFQVVEPGMHSWMAIKSQVATVKFEETPLLRPFCRQNKTFTYLDAAYTKENCEVECLVELFFNQCNCSIDVPLKNGSKGICSPKDFDACYKRTNFATDEFRSFLFACRKECRNPCEPYWTIQRVSQSDTLMVGKRYSKRISENLRYGNGRTTLDNDTLSNLIILNIYFETLAYEEHETSETNPLFISIANIGGQLSLWLGISIVTIVQAFAYVCTCMSPNRWKKGREKSSG